MAFVTQRVSVEFGQLGPGYATVFASAITIGGGNYSSEFPITGQTHTTGFSNINLNKASPTDNTIPARVRNL